MKHNSATAKMETTSLYIYSITAFIDYQH